MAYGRMRAAESIAYAAAVVELSKAYGACEALTHIRWPWQSPSWCTTRFHVDERGGIVKYVGRAVIWAFCSTLLMCRSRWCSQGSLEVAIGSPRPLLPEDELGSRPMLLQCPCSK